jgi:hypothetical protein
MFAMKTGMKASLIIITLTLVACLIVLRPRPDEPVAANVSDTSRGPSFEVHVMKPRIARPFFGILPTKLKAKIFGGGDLRFDQASPGAKFGSVGHNRLELTQLAGTSSLRPTAKGESLLGRASYSRWSSRKGNGGCFADPQIEPTDISIPPRGQAPTSSTVTSWSSSQPAQIPRRGGSSNGHQRHSPSVGVSRTYHTGSIATEESIVRLID